jgi:excisionase family DNA binding protein
MSLEKITYTVTEAAQASGLSNRKIWADIAAGRLQATRGTGRTLIPRGSLLRYLEVDSNGNPGQVLHGE